MGCSAKTRIRVLFEFHSRLTQPAGPNSNETSFVRVFGTRLGQNTNDRWFHSRMGTSFRSRFGEGAPCADPHVWDGGAGRGGGFLRPPGPMSIGHEVIPPHPLTPSLHAGAARPKKTWGAYPALSSWTPQHRPAQERAPAPEGPRPGTRGRQGEARLAVGGARASALPSVPVGELGPAGAPDGARGG